MSYQMLVLTHVVKKKSYCTGNAQFLQATSREELFNLIKNPNHHGNINSTFNQSFRLLFGNNPNEISYVLFIGETKATVEFEARSFAIGRVCNNNTSSQSTPSSQYDPSKHSSLNPNIVVV